MVDQTRTYRLMEPVGHGSFGTVWRAIMETEGGFSKEVALKILRPEAAARLDTVRRLRDEARLLGLLRHRAIVQVDGLVRVERRWAVVMELVHGVSLNELSPQLRAPLGVALEILAEIASALHDAYSQLGPDGRPLRLIHRDIKPSNIRLTASGGVKVLDFGIARADFESRETSTSSLLLGTLAYMSPERLDSIDGPEGDIYALGAMLFELVVGERIGKTSSNPMRHEDLRAAAMARFGELTGPLGPESTELLGRMIAYEPRDRPAARELEITCRRIVRRLDGESLSEWSAREVPRLVSQAEVQLEPEDTQLTGMTLVEERLGGSLGDMAEGATEPLGEPTDQSLTIQEPSAAVLPPAPLPVPEPRKNSPSLWLVVGVGVAAMLLGALIGATVLGLRPPAAPKVQSPALTLPEPVAPGVEPEVLTVQPEPMVAPEITSEPAEPVIAEPPPKLPAPAPIPEASPPTGTATGTVRVTGDAESVVLIAADGSTHAPGEVAPGTYHIRATFGGTDAGAGQVEVGAGLTHVLRCDAQFRRCLPQ